MILNFITDHVQKALDRLLYQYQGKGNIEGLVTSLVEPIQEIEDALKPLVEERGVETSIGANLDRVGVIVGIARIPGQSDDEYRLAIKNKIAQNLSQGTPEEVIATVKFFIPSLTYLWFLEVYPAEVDIFTDVEIDPDSRVAIRSGLEAFLPAGVSLGSFGQYEGPNAFLFNLAEGFGDTNDPAAGGLLADIFPDTPDLPFYDLLIDEVGRYLTDEDSNLLTTG